LQGIGSIGDQLTLYSNNNERIRIKSDGKVGIGTTTPNELLEVDGNIRLGDGGARDIIGPTNESLRILANPNSSTEGIIFSTDGGTTTEMFIQDGGNVGIGTTAPDFALDVGGDIGIDDKIYHNGDHNTYIGFTGSDTISLRTGGTDVITLDSSQRCGIGTTAPSAKLEIEGDTLTYDGMAKIYLTDTATDSGSRNWSIGNGGSAYGNLTFAVSAAKGGNAGDATGVNAFLISSDGDITQNYINYTNGSNYEALKISAGTSSIKFNTTSVGSFSSNTRPIEFLLNGNAKASITGAGVYSQGHFYIASTGSLRNTTNHLNLTTSSQTDNDIIFKPNDTEAMRIDSSGRLGLGETTPAAYDGEADDFIIKTGGNTGITIRTSSTGKGSIFFADGISGSERYQGNIRYFHSDSTMRFATGAVERFRISSNKTTLFNGALELQETTTPTATADYGKIYCKSDNKLYFQDGAGTEHEIAFV
jgi:hypothetical protein